MILKNATFIDWQTLEFKQNTNIKVHEGLNGKIEFVNTTPQSENVLDCTGKIVTKSFACGHHHVYSALARGMNAPKKSPENFFEILQYVWWTLDKCLDKDMIEASALYTAMASAKSGVSYVIDHHASPFAIEGSLEIIAKAFDKVGVSHLLCYEITDRDGLDKAEAGLMETENYLKNRNGLVGLHASFTVGNGTLKKSVDLAKKYNSGIHIHVAEDLHDQAECWEKYDKRVVERLNDFGALSFSKTILGHCLHLHEDERKLIRNSKVWVVQNAESNLNNNVGFFNSCGLGDNIMLGTDGMHSDMLRSAKAAFYIGQAHDTIDYPGVYNRFRNVHKYLQTNGLSGDGENNLVVMDYDTPTDFNQQNFLGHFLFGLESRQVKHVISSGKLIVKDGIVVNVNEQEVLEFGRKQGKILWDKMSKM
ncbi:MAG TPA: amidohydrolase [Bacteroidales bacterium]|nr:MAG: amidohydrolase [Bacteroidetes bacterium GWF2_33_38]OFY68535.1 MAG: amidohydrolase [Bacteroidetes bacterium RIFOXYA12_FULL_33_9]OFY89536.1 MAG: amidohydrolase [Bacteroidetes bacterium RIFOXYA2_FULL_33_7]HBF87287.1 amidohydrolase [Bacteroidales bacterium]